MANPEQKVDESKQNNTESRVILVTGANKGIGFSLVQLLLNNKSDTVILGCRGFKSVPQLDTTGKLRKDPAKFEVLGADKNKGKKTRIELLKEYFKDYKNIDYVELDVTDGNGIKNAVKYIKDKYRKLDILVNNAGMAWPDVNAFDSIVVDGTFKVNYDGLINVTKNFLDLIPMKTGKIINVASQAGLLKNRIKNKDMKKLLLSDTLSYKQINECVIKFKDAVKNNKVSENGFSHSAYGTSKCFVIAYSRVLAKELNSKGISVTHYCPGYCSTYMSGGKGNRSSTHGAKGIQLLCDKNVKTGLFYGASFTGNNADSGYLVNYNWETGSETPFKANNQ